MVFILLYTPDVFNVIKTVVCKSKQPTVGYETRGVHTKDPVVIIVNF